MEKICPKCGALSNTKKFFGDFCEDCYLKMIDIPLPPRISLPTCKLCGKVKLKGWERFDEDALIKLVRKNTRTEYEELHVRPLTDQLYEAVFTIKKNSNYFQIRKEFLLQRINSLCDECCKRRSGYYEAIVQIRGENARKQFRKIMREIERRTFVCRWVELDEGFDIYAGSKKAVGEALSSLNLKPKVSDKLFGVKDGRRIYRRTYCVTT